MEGEKIQKVLARAGLGSRREMERYIEAGRVKVDGVVATLGDRISETARLSVDGKMLAKQALEPIRRQVVVYHKPVGELVTRHDPEQRKTVFTRLPKLDNGRWIAIGRLDINTSGLLLLTTDGELANRLMHPRYQLIRDYAVRIYGPVGPEMIQRLQTGVDLEDGRAAFESVLPLDEGRAANGWYRVRLREGRNRLVRRLWESQGVQVSRLMRVQYGPVPMPPGLREGQVHRLTGGEIRHLLNLVGMEAPTRPRSHQRS